MPLDSMLPTQYLRAILDCLHDNHTKLWALSISFERVGFFLMFHLPELVEDICFQSLNKVSLFPAPLFNQWFTLRTHHQNHYSSGKPAEFERLWGQLPQTATFTTAVTANNLLPHLYLPVPFFATASELLLLCPALLLRTLSWENTAQGQRTALKL